MGKENLTTISFLFLSLLFIYSSEAQTYKYTLCTTSRYFDACEQINRTNSIQCIVLGDEASCLERVNRGQASFTSLSAEGSFIGSARSNIITLATFELNSERFDYQTTIITNTRVENGLAGLKNFSYCHPGFDTTEATPLTLLEFERQLISSNELNICENDGETLAEKHIKAINDFFGPSCRPGKWVQDDVLDKTLKERYPKLLQLCGATPYQTNIGRAFSQSLQCLLASDQPRVALTTISTIATERQTRNFTIYGICKNGTVSNTTTLCEWTSIPHRVVVANRENLGDLSAEFRIWFTNSVEPDVSNPITLTDTQRTLLTSVIYPDPASSYDIRVNGIQTLPEFLSTFRQNLTILDSRLCKNETRWCTISDDEQRKCEVWSIASLNYGIQPVLSCVLRSNKRDCIDAIAANTADAVTIGADFGYFAKRAGLASIAFPETVDSGLVRSVLLVKKGNITRLENLKGKKGCFPRYGGAAWFSFIATTRSIILSNTTCDYIKLLAYALGDSCMPGLTTSSINLVNTCNLCVSRDNASVPTCESDSTNLYFGNQGALDCLRDAGDFAVVTLQDGLVVPENVTVMCRNGTTTGNNSLDIDPNCFLSVITSSEIVTRRHDLSNPNIQLALTDYDRHFAVDIRSPFKLFGVFDGIKDLLFKDSTPGLDLPSSSNTAIKNYIALFGHIDECIARSDGHQLLPSLILLIVPLILLLRI